MCEPENLLLSADGQVLLGDFGIATVAQSSHSQSTQEALGTITYMAPEQIQGKPRARPATSTRWASLSTSG